MKHTLVFFLPALLLGCSHEPKVHAADTTHPRTADHSTPAAPPKLEHETPLATPSSADRDPDHALTQQVHEAIVQDSALAAIAETITITAQNGTVTLRGTVSSAEVKSSIGTAAQSVPGVQRVDNQLEVKSE